MPFVPAVRMAVPGVLLLALALPGVAQAEATLSVAGTAPNKTLTFTVGDALDHAASVAVSGGDLVLEDGVGLAVAGSGCTAIGAKTGNCGPAADYARVAFVFAEGDDHLSLSLTLAIPLTADGGAGSDQLVGGALDDQLTGGSGDDDLYSYDGHDTLGGGADDDFLVGGRGADTYDAGPGDDILAAEEAPAAADVAPIVCGSGIDTVWWDVALDAPSSDCEATGPPQLGGTLTISGTPHTGAVLTRSTPLNTGGYHVINRHGSASLESEATEIVRASFPPRTPWSPLPQLRPPALSFPPWPARFALVAKPAVKLRDGDPVLDTGRTVNCPGPVGPEPCKLSVTARFSGA